MPIAPLAKACVGGAATAGAPGVGAIAGLEHAYYVDGTPVMATMHGLDIAAVQRWGAEPDLVISGPNEGQNAGSIVISSGTVSNAQFALSRGIPSVAVSADIDTTNNPALAAEVADLTVGLIETLNGRSRGGSLLPKGLALNVNFPKFAAGESAALKWTSTRFGNFDYVSPRFVSDVGATSVGLPGA